MYNIVLFYEWTLKHNVKQTRQRLIGAFALEFVEVALKGADPHQLGLAQRQGGFKRHVTQLRRLSTPYCHPMLRVGASARTPSIDGALQQVPGFSQRSPQAGLLRGGEVDAHQAAGARHGMEQAARR